METQIHVSIKKSVVNAMFLTTTIIMVVVVVVVIIRMRFTITFIIKISMTCNSLTYQNLQKSQAHSQVCNLKF